MKRIAFTLAEVLITLGIIGVVAALTIPSLIQNYKKQEASARLKKFYSIMNQAITLSEIDNGPSNTWTKDPYNDSAGVLPNATRRNSTIKFFNTYIKNYIKYAKIDENPDVDLDENGESNFLYVYLPDSSYIRISNGQCIDFAFDINGTNKPNEYGKDIFKFLLCTDKTYQNNQCGPYINVCAYGGTFWFNKNRAELVDNCKNNSEFCAALLMIDGLEFKDDYPHKL